MSICFKLSNHLIIKIHSNHVDVGALLNFRSTLHPETNMANPSNGISFPKLFFHHDSLIDFVSSIIHCHMFFWWNSCEKNFFQKILLFVCCCSKAELSKNLMDNSRNLHVQNLFKMVIRCIGIEPTHHIMLSCARGHFPAIADAQEAVLV